ncbi:nucleotide pyrophosphatase/phosphodiesterase family protein [Ketogulonicigenium vulgare]|uniref:Type I phosphodiesterase / nucleotide pyrophosphatase superfamily protein n=1 Tax=Ketogulonicigenium vulgare (strain WSH-001) TaxID=759362 RepID=F9YB64_KETVW|nr:nucleotide pyrophosphatase/phosphodiesterase family protein [Ketogulonicigenium vulgare]ADO44093.1 type I phosphodiesterase/nucleotide pyrophosphatase [Ketogulonicigenium vulgare Y25]AEM42616.1 Type I phosphodiesterase / nucleotide pyrophosphatase superfamily protein [Ketogulonicigenium vulgare WSH-001]ALJ82641.1 phosphodiesterase [Ketogulonicigenium vulgare]ANW35396.1 phosphodiesterase [Ketogulonicigenium vulgare]AOZ53318.1 type I phosphodiesterase/nucleotide pyrophosphatase [Ketogulonicig
MENALVLLVVGLTPAMVGEHTPNIARLAEAGGMRPLQTVVPAVTCTVQATLMTGELPAVHGAVANGWLFRDTYEVALWKQSETLLSGETIWDAGKKRDAGFTCAKMFWWYNMQTSADWSATPRPMYPADGRKVPDHYTQPGALRDELNAHLGPFPLFNYWGPTASIASTNWIVGATRHVMDSRDPTLTLAYIPHLDYDLQRLGPDLANPDIQRALREVDAAIAPLIAEAQAQGRAVIIVSEYGITPVRDAIHINRALREAGMIAWRDEMGREMIDLGASRAFAMVDHQIAHIYVRDAADIEAVAELVRGLDGVESVTADTAALGLDHPRAGELVAISAPDRWFSYYYWLDEAKAPDYAATVDIHRKPGYDPVELFVDPALRAAKAQIIWKIAKRKLGMRGLLDIISTHRSDLVKGSHGRLTDRPEDGPLVISTRADLLPEGPMASTAFKAFVLDHIFA